eukprot:1142476-Pelagomonas_calceolata.AAC.3
MQACLMLAATTRPHPLQRTIQRPSMTPAFKADSSLGSTNPRLVRKREQERLKDKGFTKEGPESGAMTEWLLVPR